MFIQNSSKEMWCKYWQTKQDWNDWCYNNFIEILESVQKKRFVNALNIDTDFSSIIKQFKELKLQLL